MQTRLGSKTLRRGVQRLCNLLWVSLLIMQGNLQAQVIISGGTSPAVLAGNPYATLSSAITALNGGGAPTAPVVVNVAAGHTETLSSRITLTLSGTISNTISIQKSGVGLNPRLTSFAGTVSTPSPTADGMFAIAGGDYITIDGIDLLENPLNTTATTCMEFGYGLFVNSVTDGCQNVTIKNCNILMNRINNASWTTGTGYRGSTGIHLGHTTSTAVAVLIPTSPAGSHSNNKFYSNNIQNCNTGISLTGYAAPSPFTLADTGNDIGGNSSATGNTILNFGGAASATQPATGIHAINQWELNCSNNNINNNNGSGVNHVSTLRGIFLETGSTSANASCNNNIVSINGGGTTSEVSGISVNMGSTAASNTIHVNGNDVSGTYLTATSGVFYGIHVNTTPTTININNNVVHDMSYSAAALTGSGVVYGIYNQLIPVNVNILNNQVSNISRTGTTGATTIGIFCSGGNTQTVKNNTVNSLSISGSGTASTMYGIQTTTGTIVCDSNTVHTLQVLKTTGTSVLYGIYNVASPTNENYNYNTVYNVSHAGTGTTYGMFMNTTTGVRQVSYNTVHTISSNGNTVAGIAQTLSSPTLFGNRIYNIFSTSATTPIVSGIVVTSLSASGTLNIRNNLIGHINAPNANTASAAAPSVRGINLTLTTTFTNLFVAYNTIYLNATSSGANFGAAGIFHTCSFTAPSTTANLTLQNNIIYNNSVAAGTGLVAAYQRSTSNKANYNPASDRNIFYGGPSSPTQLIYTDTVAFDLDITSYKATMLSNGADQNSYEENVQFISTVGSSPDFLKFDTGTPSAAESGANNIAGITSDYAGTIRQGNAGYTGTGSAPDVGAWELEGTALGGCFGPPGSSNAVSSNTTPCTGANFTLSLDVIYGIGYSYQWQESTTGPLTGFSNVANATNTTLVTSTLVNKWFRCIVKCVASNDSIFSGAAGVTISTLNGTYTIDNTGAGDYMSFADAISDLSCRGVSGPVTFLVTPGQIFTETSNLNCTFSGTASNTISFVKNGAGADPIIERPGTSATTDYILRLTGVDYYTFDGIEFRQTGTSSTDYVEYGIHIVNNSSTDGAQFNTIKNCTVSTNKLNASSRGIYVQSPITPVGLNGTNSNNRFLNNKVYNSFVGYQITGASTTFNDDANEINIESGGQSSIYDIGDATVTGSVYGVFGSHQTNFSLKNTEVYNLNASGTSLVYGITLQTSAANTFDISYNHFHDITGPGTVTGIHITSASAAAIYNNIFNGLLSTTATTGIARAMNVSATAVVSNIYNNIVYDINSQALTTGAAVGIECGTGTHYIYNNMVSDLHAPASTNTTGGIKGISITGGTASTTTRIFNNTVYLNDVGTVAAYTAAGIHNSSTTPNLDIRNNVIVNNADVSLGTRAAAFWKTATTDNVDPASNNNLWYCGTPGTKNLIYYDGTNSLQTIAAYQGSVAITPGETNAVTENVAFAPIMNGVLRPNPAIPTYIESYGLPIAGLTTDFEGDIRNVTTPDLGADEGNFIVYVPPVPDCATLLNPVDALTGVCPTTSLNLTWLAPTTGGPVNQGYDVYFGTSAIPPFVTNTNSLSYTLTGLLPNTTYYWQIVPKGTSGPATGCVVYSFTTLDVQVTGVTGATRCGPGSVTLSATGSGTLAWFNSAIPATPLATGNSFTTNVNGTTTFYVASVDGFTSGTMGRSEALAGTSGTTAVTYGLVFNAFQPLTIDSVTIVLNTTAGGTLVVQLRDSLSGSTGPGTFIRASANITVPTGAIGDRVRIPLGFSVPAGNGYRLLAISSPSLIRSSSAGGYPYNASNGAASITSGFITNSGSSTYYYFYDWRISSGCVSATTPVTATVTPSDPIMVTPSALTRCEFGAPDTLVASSTYPYVYTWANSTGLNTTSGATVLASPTATTTYTVTGDDGICSNSTTITITVNEAPDNFTVTTNAPVCEGSTVNLSASALVPGYQMNTACTTTFTDISTTGTSVGTLSDDSEHNLSIPAFTFNGVSYTSLRIGTNGAIALGSNSGDIFVTNSNIPSTANSAGNIVLYPFWDDLDIQTGAVIYTEVVGNRQIIQFHNMAHNNFTTGSVTFQVQLDLVTGEIFYVYNDVVFGDVLYDQGVSASVGLQWSGTNGIQFSFNTASLNNGQCIAFTPNSVNYNWSGPGGFNASIANPSISNASTANAGTYTVSATSSTNGCSTTTTIQVNVNTSTHNAPTVQVACDTYTWSRNGNTYTTSGQYTATYLNVTGCVSYDTLNLTVNYSNSATIQVTANGCYTWPVNNTTYTTSGTYYGTSTNVSGCDSNITMVLTIIPGTQIMAKAILSGCYDPGNGLMNDHLRNMGLVPTTEEYSLSPVTPAIVLPSGETTTASVLSTTGNNAIVDWVYLEIRSGANSSNILASLRALIQRDGDIVSHTDGVSPVFIPSYPSGNYFISVKHRNHLGVMTSSPVNLGPCPVLIDYTQVGNIWVKPGENNPPVRMQNSLATLWAGDANRNKNAKYNGLANDKNTVLSQVGNATPNNVVSNVYRPEDLNMDGQIKYNNLDNDRQVIAVTVGVSTPNNIVNQHTPN